MDIIISLYKLLKSRKKLWLMPIFFIIIVVSFLILAAETTAIGPFLYTLF